MKPCYVSGLEASQLITSSFLVYSKEIREKKTGEPYLSLLLADKTGRIDAKMWDNVNEVLASFDRDDFVKVKALVQIHQNRPQLTIHKIRRLDDHEVEFVDFYPCSSRDPDVMWGELLTIAGEVKNPYLRALLQAFLSDNEIAVRFRRAPAAKTIHHAFLGGLLEHVLSLCNLSRSVASHYPHIDVDLLITGAVLHDVGKVYELTYDRGFGYSVEGQLLGHIPLAMRMLSGKLRDLPDFPDRLRTLVEHMILSHHGQLEFGSPRVPLFAEAMLFHYLDDMDSKMECMRNLVENDRTGDQLFTGYSSPLQRVVLRKQAFLHPVPPAASVVPQVAEPARQQQQASRQEPSSSPFGAKLLDALREN
jgi:3'-5' exoribonuclease